MGPAPAPAITQTKTCKGIDRDTSGRLFREREKDHPALGRARREAERGHGLFGMAGACDKSS